MFCLFCKGESGGIGLRQNAGPLYGKQATAWPLQSFLKPSEHGTLLAREFFLPCSFYPKAYFGTKALCEGGFAAWLLPLYF